ncbi:MAG: DUF1080 domain-containing protein [Opitutus sp.]|nr:DUF1080 domain-containing protein [Opitutus sp.]
MKPHPFVLIFTLALGLASAQAADNQLTATEKAAGWQLVFDGKSLDGWRGYRLKGVPENLGWEVNDGTLHAKQVKYDMSNIPMAQFRKSELITEKKFNDFELSWDWKLSKAANNGIKYFVTEERPSAPGPEYQMMDDANHPDGKMGPTHHTGAFYDVLPGAADKASPIGQWNTSRVVVRGNHVEHWLNGQKVVDCQLGSPEVKAGLAKSKFKNEPGFGEKIAGHIMLTYHGDETWVKNFKVRELK